MHKYKHLLIQNILLLYTIYFFYSKVLQQARKLFGKLKLSVICWLMVDMHAGIPFIGTFS